MPFSKYVDTRTFCVTVTLNAVIPLKVPVSLPLVCYQVKEHFTAPVGFRDKPKNIKKTSRRHIVRQIITHTHAVAKYLRKEILISS